MKNNWRSHWFVKNCLIPLPFLGPFFDGSLTGKGRLLALLSYTCMLTGGTTFMMLNLFGVTKSDDSTIKAVKMIGEMAIGMATGKIACNLLFFSTEKLANPSTHESTSPTLLSNTMKAA